MPGYAPSGNQSQRQVDFFTAAATHFFFKKKKTDRGRLSTPQLDR